MPTKRDPAAKLPSRAQAAFLDRFEQLYKASQDQLEIDVQKARLRYPALAPSKRLFSKSTFHSWKRQDTSPTLHDMEVLSSLTGESQTLLIDPALLNGNEGDQDVEWLEDARKLLDEMAALSPHQRSSIIGELRGIVQRETMRSAQRNPRVSDDAAGPRVVRRSKGSSGPTT